MAHGIVLGLHITAGALGLVFGPLAWFGSTRSGRSVGPLGAVGPVDPVSAVGPVRRPLAAYQVSVVVLCATALVLAAMAWSRLWPFSILAIGTGAAVVGGWSVRRHRAPGWQPWFVRLTAGSYVSLVTALLVVSWGTLAAWLLPTLVGVPLVERAAARAGREAEVSPPGAEPR